MPKPTRLVIIGGCGHVGLPLGIVFANCGINVVLLDVSAERITTVNSGRAPFMENAAAEHLKAVIGKTLVATSDSSCLKTADAAIAVVGTPVDEHLNPTVTELYRNIDATIDILPEGALLVLRSTVYPGVTKLVYDRVQSRGRKIHIAFCPERIAEGKAMEEIRSLPQIISAFEPEALQRVRELFSIINDELIELTPLEAELAKLFTNSWRYLNFAISNQFYLLAESYGLDFYRIYESVTRRYPRMKSFARAGFAAGPCLLKDTLQLAAFSGNNFFMGHAAMLVNEGLPNFVVSQLRSSGLRDKTVAILGMAFKGDSDDKRESLSYKLRKLLVLESKEVLCTDPYVQDEDFVSLEDAVQLADIIILGAPHTVYRALRIPQAKQVVDIWGFWPERQFAEDHEVIGLDNFSKYGPAGKSYDTNPRYKFVEGDAKNVGLLKELVSDCDHFVAAAAMIGGISYFHEFAYDLLAENERITAASFEAAIWAHRDRKLRKITVLSSSMVFESTNEFPTPEGAERRCPPPRSTYGFQKLATEFFVQGAHEQYKLPYTIARPFNCVGIGEKRALCDREIMSGNVRLALAVKHVTIRTEATWHAVFGFVSSIPLR